MEENKNEFKKQNNREGTDEEYGDNILIDDDGTAFEVLDSFMIDDKSYVVLALAESDGEEENDVFIYRFIEGEEDDEFIAIEDEDELNNAFEEFKARNSDMFDFEDNDDEDDEDDEE